MKQTPENLTDTNAVFKPPFTAIHNFTNRLTPNVRLFITVILGMCAGYGWSSGSLLFFVIGALLMVTAVGLTVKLSWAIKIAAFIGFILSSLLLVYFDSSMIAAESYSYIMIFAIVWIILYGLASHALNVKLDNFQYVFYILSWLLLVLLSTALKYLLLTALIPLTIIKIYQLAFIDKWTRKGIKAYVFSVVYPISLCIGLFTYAHFETQATEVFANKMAKDIVAYHDKTGSYPAKNIIMREDMEYYVNYTLSISGEPYLWYKKPMIETCRYTYLFDSNEWEEYCFD